MPRIITFLILSLGCGLASASAQVVDPSGGAFWQYDPTQKIAAVASPVPPSVTHHQLTVNGQSLNYTATAATLPLRNATTEKTEGEIFFVYYSKEGAPDTAKRPLMFIFNGGPGTAALWLHMLAFGPKRVNLLPDGSAPAPPSSYLDNPNTLLDQADLVFIDPVGTGYSRPAQPADGAKFWGMANDVASIGEFIRLFLVRYERWGSPKYVLGESYGTYRAAELSSYLVDRGMPLNGVILVSSLFDDDTRAGDAGSVNFLPTFATTAWYHKRLAPDLQKLTVPQVARLAEEFASGEYVTALYQGSRLSAQAKDKVADGVARFTGLSKTVIANNDLGVTLPRFQAELLRDRRLIVGRLDGRVTAFAPDGAAIQAPFDAASVDTENAVVSAFSAYARAELNYRSERIYYAEGGGVGPWPGVRQARPAMENAFARNSHLRLFVALGYFDLATIYYGFDWSLSHLRISPEVRAHNITVGRYESGHMIYTDLKALEQLRRDLRGWLVRSGEN